MTIRSSPLIIVLLLSQIAKAQSISSAHWWVPDQRVAQVEFESALQSVPTPASLRGFHDLLGSEPHLAGTPGDQRVIQKMIDAFESMGLQTQKHEFWAYLSKPIEAKVEVITSTVRVQLPIKEEALAEDPFTDSAEHSIGFNAYSASGDVIGEVVYANYGTKSDFEKLTELNIDCKGKIVIARYGGNFRGYKAKFAQQAGAIGLIIYTDPEDSGFRKGLPYPEGGWASGSYIQRGSINTLPYPGDPLTPGEAAVRDARRLQADQVELPGIPVHPIGYAAASEIITRMQGTPLPQDLVNNWQGGLPCAYRLAGGSDLKVRLSVKQERSIVASANVIATLAGSKYPEQKIIIGCHHDAWGCGASDPLAGTILVFEAARSFAEAAKNGHRPLRSIIFATWGAEEHGIVGSTEYCEQYKDDLIKNAVAYINLDMAAMGSHFGSAAAPSLKRIIEEVAKDVPPVDESAAASVHQQWLGAGNQVEFGNLGGGSDHVGFYCHLGIPSCSLGAGGSQGTSYHSTYDTLAWYRKVVGDDYKPALMLTRMVNLLGARLSNATLLPLDPVQYGTDFKEHLSGLMNQAAELNPLLDLRPLQSQASHTERLAAQVHADLLAGLEQNLFSADQLDDINRILVGLERRWLLASDQPGNSERWYRNMFASSDPDSGYAAWMLPELREAIEAKDQNQLQRGIRGYEAVLSQLSSDFKAIRAHLVAVGQTPE